MSYADRMPTTTEGANTGNASIDGAFAIDQAFRSMLPTLPEGETLAEYGVCTVLQSVDRSDTPGGYVTRIIGVYQQHQGDQYELIATWKSFHATGDTWTAWVSPFAGHGLPAASTEQECRESAAAFAAEHVRG